MASKVDLLLSAYELVLQEPWSETLSGQERVWFLVYDPADQRRMDLHIGDFENVTRRAGKKWTSISLKHCFPEWMAKHEYREEYFKDPESLVDQLEADFKFHIIDFLKSELSRGANDENTMIAIKDVSAIFGFARLSEILNAISSHFQGRMLIFFPGEYDKNHYRLLDARDGWSYLARPILS